MLQFSLRSLRQLKWAYTWLQSRYKQRYPIDVWQRSYIISEEYLTNFLKYGKTSPTHYCRLRITFKTNHCLLHFYDNTPPFNPFSAFSQDLGLRLLTQLGQAHYRYTHGKNHFCVVL